MKTLTDPLAGALCRRVSYGWHERIMTGFGASELNYPALTMSVIPRLAAVPLVLVLVGCSGAATWAHDPSGEVGPDTTEFTAWVTETACASGQSSADRIIGPDIRVSADEVVVTFGVRARLALAGTCQGNPPTRVIVSLPEALGERALLDGGREPPDEPPACIDPALSCD